VKEAHYYNRQGEKVICNLCPQRCKIGAGETGRCRVRKVKDGKLIATTYNQVGSVALDPIEKKPLYHFYPGTEILSVGTVGCNLECKFCQNYKLAHDPEQSTRNITPEELVELAQENGALGIAYTYSEPLVWYEYVLAASKQAAEAGLKNVLVTNGVINPEPMQELLPYIDAVNLDLKAFNNDFYRQLCGGELEPVKETAKLIHDQVLLEITTLLVTDLNDDLEEVGNLVDWIASLDEEIPFHLSRYFPRYKLTNPQTPEETMIAAKKRAEEKLSYVYLGNMRSRKSRHTYCPQCGTEVISRGYKVQVNLEDRQCPDCGREIRIVY
jgi:pyruvate formate lyase activating enzyme